MDLLMETPVSNVRRTLQHTKIWLGLWIVLNLVELIGVIALMTDNAYIGTQALLHSTLKLSLHGGIFVALTGLFYVVRFKLLRKPLHLVLAVILATVFVLGAPVTGGGVAYLSSLISSEPVFISVIDLLGLFVSWFFGSKILDIK